MDDVATLARMRFLVLVPVALLALGSCRNDRSPSPSPSPSPDGGLPADAGTDGGGTPTDGGTACLLVEAGDGPTGQVPIQVDVVAEGLEVPWSLAFLPDGSLLVSERPTRSGKAWVRRAVDGAVSPTPVLEVTASAGQESGLLGIALHPQFASNRSLYLYVTVDVDGGQENQVQRWVLSEDFTRATFDRLIVGTGTPLGGIPSALYHDGGRLRFGPDGMLYVGTGDGRVPSRSQDPDSLAGKLLRLTPDGEVPNDNPLPGKAAFLTGIRNTQGFDWRDAQTLYVTDHGPSGDTSRTGHDEVNVVRAGDNLGWPDVYSCETREGLVTPVLTWEKAVPPGGAAVYTGDAIPEWKGSLLIASLGARHLHRVRFDAQGRVEEHDVYLAGAYGRLRDAIMGPDGHLYVTTSNCDGRATCPSRKDLILRVRR